MSDKPPENEVNPSKRSSPIQAYCTVDPQYLERDGEELICHKCSRRLINAEKTTPEQRAKLAKAGKLVCGFASGLALASCATKETADSSAENDAEDCSGSSEHVVIDEEPWSFPEGLVMGVVAVQKEFSYPPTIKSSDSLPATPTNLMPSFYPYAEAVKEKPGFVISPYGGHEVDISRIPEGESLVIDPVFPVEEKKFMRIRGSALGIEEMFSDQTQVSE